MDSVLIVLGMNVVQRLVGFLRSVLFCRWLEPEALGQWDMAFAFLMLAAPLSMLAIPAAFGRYVEHYRQRDQLRMFFRRTGFWCVGFTGASCVVIYLARPWFSGLIFGTRDQTVLVSLVAATLFVMVANHYFIELLTAMRNARALALLQFANSLLFALLGVGLLLGWQQTATSVVVAYGGACVLTAIGVLFYMRSTWQALPVAQEYLPQRVFWAKVLPYAVWVWVTSFMANLFVIADRYMILHHAKVAPEEALAMVGQYHSSRIVPVLMISIAMMLSGIVTPHLSYDWEGGRRDRVGARLNLFAKLLGLALTTGGVAVLLAKPLLFDWALEGKFSDGLEVLPLTLTYCIWFGMTTAVQIYLLCAEKARLASYTLAAGLVANVVLNLILLPKFGLIGAVTATTAANLIALTLSGLFAHLLGFRFHPGTLIILASPLLLQAGVWISGGALVAIGILAVSTRWVFSGEEKVQLMENGRAYWSKWRRSSQ